MLKGISPLMSPELLSVLYRMGHGDDIVLADAHFPGETMGQRVVRADGLLVPDLLHAILPLFVLDDFVEHPVRMMEAVEGYPADPGVEKSYRNVIGAYYPETPAIGKVERFAFYEEARSAFVVVQTGDTATYGNIILRKGVMPTEG